ncbi:MAG: glycosyltransferase family 4 protein [Thermoleophilaceae bacterium]|nr:glycosyltransferase family 4 protein [Thermoleophilaceae bacterium]
MRVAIELTALQLDRGGTARAIEQLLPRLEAEPGVELVRLEHEGRVPTSSLGVIARGLARELWYLPRVLPQRVAASGAEILHCPSQLVPPSCVVPMVVTLHDAIGWEHPEWLTRANVAQLHKRLPRAIASGAHVITSSEYSRGRLIAALDLDPARITTVPLGLDSRFTPEAAAADADAIAALGVGEPYVLTVGTLQPRKNLAAAIEAFELLGSARAEHLVIVGARGWHDDELIQRIERSTASGRIHLLGRVTDDELIALYRGAECLVFPSRYEGFGFPPLEAMACGTPVISTDNTSLAEAIGDAAEVIDPDDPEQIAETLARVLGSPELRGEMIERGLAHAATFTWQACADATVAVYRALLAKTSTQ